MQYWCIVAAKCGIFVVDLPTNEHEIIQAFSSKDHHHKEPLACKSLVQNNSGDILYTGWSDGVIRVYKLEELTTINYENSIPARYQHEGDL